MNDKQKLAHDMEVLRKLNENQNPMDAMHVSQVGTVQEEEGTTYDSLWKELSQVVSGDALEKVMAVLKKNNLIQGDLEGEVEWLFNFEGGGWNSVYAKTKEEAIKKAHHEYDETNLSIMDNSFRPSTKDDYEMNMRNFD